eukprot:CAMPEP_0183349034 /NCGR_PEP_ID=MMETSP0164_2-20130417/13345_1 /TAXON_ID=221442 /ORGANISM="Coccolithus pelagicus ssp braarudi, Strain PLY182g" /LENGTH=404 /DNA_ID=CAMNT_0025520703 /DNA_START=587 /DNA_END=1799 /DNA_ORIENTATION=+
MRQCHPYVGGAEPQVEAIGNEREGVEDGANNQPAALGRASLGTGRAAAQPSPTEQQGEERRCKVQYKRTALQRHERWWQLRVAIHAELPSLPRRAARSLPSDRLRGAPYGDRAGRAVEQLPRNFKLVAVSEVELCGCQRKIRLHGDRAVAAWREGERKERAVEAMPCDVHSPDVTWNTLPGTSAGCGGGGEGGYGESGGGGDEGGDGDGGGGKGGEGKGGGGGDGGGSTISKITHPHDGSQTTGGKSPLAVGLPQQLASFLAEPGPPIEKLVQPSPKVRAVCRLASHASSANSSGVVPLSGAPKHIQPDLTSLAVTPSAEQAVKGMGGDGGDDAGGGGGLGGDGGGIGGIGGGDMGESASKGQIRDQSVRVSLEAASMVDTRAVVAIRGTRRCARILELDILKK